MTSEQFDLRHRQGDGWDPYAGKVGRQYWEIIVVVYGRSLVESYDKKGRERPVEDGVDGLSFAACKMPDLY